MKTTKPVSVEEEDEALFSFKKEEISTEKIEAHWKMIHERIKQYEKDQAAQEELGQKG